MKTKIGEFIVQDSQGFIEIVTQGCMVCFFQKRKCDGEMIVELHEVHDRITSLEYDKEDFYKAIRVGRKLAEVLLDFVTSTTPKEK